MKYFLHYDLRQLEFDRNYSVVGEPIVTEAFPVPLSDLDTSVIEKISLNAFTSNGQDISAYDAVALFSQENAIKIYPLRAVSQ